LFVGYPDELNTDAVHAQLAQIPCSPIPRRQYQQLGLNPEFDLAGYYDLKTCTRIDDGMNLGIDPVGMSGGPVMIATSHNADLKHLDFKIKGFGTHFSEAAKYISGFNLMSEIVFT